MAKKTKKRSSAPKKALPSMIEDLAKWLRNEVKEKGPTAKKPALQGAAMSNTIEQIALILRKKAQTASKKSTRTLAKKKQSPKPREPLRIKRKTKAKS